MREYIVQARNTGLSDAAITETLRAQGWASDIIATCLSQTPVSEVKLAPLVVNPVVMFAYLIAIGFLMRGLYWLPFLFNVPTGLLHWLWFVYSPVAVGLGLSAIYIFAALAAVLKNMYSTRKTILIMGVVIIVDYLLIVAILFTTSQERQADLGLGLFTVFGLVYVAFLALLGYFGGRLVNNIYTKMRQLSDRR